MFMGLVDLWLFIGIGNHHYGTKKKKKKIQSLPNLRVKGKERHVVFLFLYFKNLIDKYPKPINPNSLNKSKPNVTQIS